MKRDKVMGMFLGVAIGDALGMPVEMKSAEQIQKEYGRIEEYKSPHGHKFFHGLYPGTWTDDTSLTLAVANALIEAKGFDMNMMVTAHLKAPEVRGWGKTTQEALERLKNGVHWSQSGKSDIPNRGVGNGVAMKVSPLAAVSCWEIQDIVDLTKMTHNTGMAVGSALAHIAASYLCLRATEPKLPDIFVEEIVRFSSASRIFSVEKEPKDDLSKRLALLKNHEHYTVEKIISDFKGSPYVYESLPFAYMFFVKNPLTIDCLYDVVSAGGDTDSNGSFVGGLLGALHGTKIFPQHLVDGLKDRELVESTAERFCNCWGIK